MSVAWLATGMDDAGSTPFAATAGAGGIVIVGA
jgi:hypothetical protein